MHYSLNLLKKFISCSTPVSEIANALTLKVCEIEHIKQRLLPDNVIIGKTINVERHPNADKLFVCQINC
jgi:phenylalanyl-tRNA synthetase beta chain